MRIAKNSYGYGYEGMKFISFKNALKAFEKGEAVYLLYPDDTEALSESPEDIRRHKRLGGIFGMEKKEPNTPGTDIDRKRK